MRAELFSAGDLDRRITIEQLQPDVDDGLRVKVGGWAPVKRPFAALVPITGSERMAAGETAAFQVQKFRIRRPRSLSLDSKNFRIRYGNRIGNIAAVTEIDRDKIDLVCTMRDDEAPDSIE